MSHHGVFGGNDRYYSTATQDEHIGCDDSQLSRDIERVVLQHNPDMRDRVDRAFKQWNVIIREQLRTEMGLRLTVGNEYQSIPVRIVDGLPKPMQEKLVEFNPIVWELLFNKGRLETTLEGLGFLFHNCNELTNEVPPGSLDIEEHLRLSYNYLDRIVDEINMRQILKRIFDTDHDTLGSYFFRGAFINIYWLAIGIAAGGLGVSPEALTVVVAAHELAHAYSHMGKDIDSEFWATDAFADADTHIVEGIAQYYTHAVCDRLKDRMPYAAEAFEKLLEQQSSPYTHHRKWDLPGKSSGEIVRISMISCRSRGLTNYADFLSLLHQNTGIKPSRIR